VTKFNGKTLLLVGPVLWLTLCASAKADVIVNEYQDNFGGAINCLGAGSGAASLSLGPSACEAAGGFVMTQFAANPHAPGTLVTSVDSPLGGTVHFLEQGGTDPSTDALNMIVGDPADLLPSGDPDWWQYDDHGSVYMTHVNWIELLFDTDGADPVRAFSAFVGADFNGRGWIQGFDLEGNETTEHFRVSPGDSPGFGVYGSSGGGSCSTITRVFVEPYHLWGVGNFAVNQDPCVAVPAPNSLALLGLGLLGVGLSRKLITT